jgi:hypothetical protein
VSDQTEQSYSNSALKFAGVSVGLAYSLGFLVVARHLSRYGVSTFSVLQTQFLVAGIWTVAPLIAIEVVLRTAGRFSDKAYNFSMSSRRRFYLIPTITGISTGLLIGVLSILLEGFEGFTWKLGVRLWLSYLLLAGSADLAWMSWKSAENSERWWANRYATPFYGTVLCLGVVLYALNFAAWIYPLIPYSLGGGRPRTIVFLSGEKPLPTGLIKDNSSERSVPYKLLTETDKSYVVISPNQNEESILINRDAVQGIVVLKESHAP